MADLGERVLMSSDREHAELALRALQKLDELESVSNRYLIIQAEDHLGVIADLVCTGEVDGVNADGTPAFYDHNGETCPIHEWLVEADGREIHAMLRSDSHA